MLKESFIREIVLEHMIYEGCSGRVKLAHPVMFYLKQFWRSEKQTIIALQTFLACFSYTMIYKNLNVAALMTFGRKCPLMQPLLINYYTEQIISLGNMNIY